MIASFTHAWLLGAKQPKACCQSLCISIFVPHHKAPLVDRQKQDGAQRAASSKATICSEPKDLAASYARPLQRFAMVSLIVTWESLVYACWMAFAMIYTFKKG